jgi:predicted tellurium resistance membrane protein TerC
MTVPRSGPRQFRGEAPPQVGASRTKGFVVDFLAQDFMHAPFWIAVLQIIGVNIILSGDNAVVIAMACMTLPAKQRLWGMILGAGVAVLLRVIFTLVVAQAMTYPFLKLVGGLLLFYVAIKLVTEDSVKAGDTLLRAVWLVTVADIVMSLDNVIAIAAAAANGRPMRSRPRCRRTTEC